VTGGCQRGKKEVPESKLSSQELEHFSLRQFSDRVSLEVTGETAEMTADQKTAIVQQPGFSLKSADSLIEVRTGGEGRAEIRFSPQRQQMEAAILEGKITVTQKALQDKKVLMEATCQKLTYEDREKVLLMEGNPVITRDHNSFSGEKIYYYWTENRIEIKGNVKVLVYPEKTQAP